MVASISSDRVVRIVAFSALAAAIAVAVVAGAGHNSKPAMAAAPNKQVYQFKGLGANFTAYKDDCKGSYVSVSGWEESSHTAGSGSFTNSNYGYVYFATWDSCSGPYTSSYGSGYGPVTLTGGGHRAQISGEVPVSGYTYPGWGPFSTTVALDVTLAADGEYSSNGLQQSRYSDPWSSTRYRYVGSYDTAAVTGTAVIDGNDLLDSPDYVSGDIQRSNNGQMVTSWY